MADQFLGQLTLAAFNFAPQGWALCSGQLLSISQNTALFSLLGVNFGGDGKSNFGLPNLQGNIAVGMGQGPGLSQYDIGETGGSAGVTLLTTEVPPHTHTANAHPGRADATTAANNAFADSPSGNVYYSGTSPALTPMAQTISSVGGGVPHNNLMPYLTLNWIIALQGVYPPRS